MKSIVIDNIKIEVNDDIFNFLYPDSNEIISEMSNSDKLYMRYLLKQYYLELRDKLGISDGATLGITKDVTFGLEIEFEESYRDIIESEIREHFSDKKWTVEDDGSLSNGGEVISPKLNDSEDTWIDLSHICDIVSENAYVMDNTGGHIHIGMHILGNNPKYWANFVKLWMTYENVIFRFLNGEYLTPRSRILEQARPISGDLIKNLDRINDRAKKISAYQMFKVLDAGEDFKERRKRAINFTNVSELEPYQYNSVIEKNTIEFRSPNGTFNPVIWQNNVNLLVHLFMYARSDKFDEDKINKRMLEIIHSGIPSNLNKYSYIYMDQAMELADLVFDNNLDKVYFLRQYFKSGEVSREPFVIGQGFTRKKCK